MRRSSKVTNNEQVIRDFDRIAHLPDEHDSGNDRYDSFIVAALPAAAVRVLDVGCGTGRLMAKVDAPGRRIVGVDISPGMIARARKRNDASSRCEFIAGDFLQLPLPEATFDCVVSAAALHHMPADRVLVKMGAMLRPGGRLIIQDLRRTAGLVDFAAGVAVLVREALGRLAATGRPWPPRHVRRAWADHAANDTYLSIAEAAELAKRYLPGARVHSHPGWRYTIIWDKPPAA